MCTALLATRAIPSSTTACTFCATDCRSCCGERAGSNCHHTCRFDPGGQEVGAASPPWGVVDMFMSWAEMQVHGLSVAADRLAWMVDRAAFMAMPVGEAVDGTAKTFVMISCPDLYVAAYFVPCSRSPFDWRAMLLQLRRRWCVCVDNVDVARPCVAAKPCHVAGEACVTACGIETAQTRCTPCFYWTRAGWYMHKLPQLRHFRAAQNVRNCCTSDGNTTQIVHCTSLKAWCRTPGGST